MRLRDAVELRQAVVAAPDERADAAGLGLDDDERALERRLPGGGRGEPAVRLLETLEPLGDGALRRLLQVHVERRVDLQPLGLELLAVALGQLALDEVDEVRRLGSLLGARPRRDRLLHRLSHRRVVDSSLVPHQAEDQVAPLPGALGIPKRRVGVGGADHPGQRRRLGEIEVRHLLAEVVAGRLADAGDRDRAAPPEVDLVQVGLEDLVLGVAGVEHHGHDRLVRLAPEGALGREVEVLHELLRERRAALLHPPGQRRKERAEESAHGHAAVAIEVAVLRHEHRVDQRARRVREPDHGAIFELGREDRAQQLRLENESRHALARCVDDRLDPLAGERQPQAQAREVVARVTERARVDLDRVLLAPIVSGAFRGRVDRLIVEARELGLEVAGRHRVARPQHVEVRVDARGKVPAAPVEALYDSRREVGEHQHSRQQQAAERRQDRYAVPVHPQRKRNQARARRAMRLGSHRWGAYRRAWEPGRDV